MTHLPNKRDVGFTLIELMVVVLIIAILLAIAVPTFLGARNKANDAAAKSSLVNALRSAKAIYADSGSYLPADNLALAAAEPSLTFNPRTVPSTSQTNVSVDGGTNPGPAPGTVWTASVKSKTGKCYWIKDDTNYPSLYTGTRYFKFPGSHTSYPCQASTNIASSSYGADPSIYW